MVYMLGKAWFFNPLLLINTVGGHKLDHLAINSTTAVAAEVRVNPALPATAVVELVTKWLNLYPHTVSWL